MGERVRSLHAYPVAAAAAVGVLAGAVIEVTRRHTRAANRYRRRLDREHAALRRIATLVARGVPPRDVFAAVAVEMRELTRADATGIVRFETDGTGTMLAAGSGEARPDRRVSLYPWPAWAEMLRTGRAARIDGHERISPAMSSAFGIPGPFPAAVASPVIVDGRLWGAILVASGRGPLPVETEAGMVDFTELLAIAIANAETHAQLLASRARVVVAGDEARRRVERNLHDGVQQRLVSLALRLRAAEGRVPRDQLEVRAALTAAVEGLNQATEEVREIAQGLHPAILTQGGLAPALRTLARRSSLPVNVTVDSEDRLPVPVEVAVYYVATEALANAAKHAAASRASVALERCDVRVRLRISDDGAGGADPAHGTGLIGLRDRIEALGGSFAVHSPRGQGTTLDVELPVPAEGRESSG